MYEEDKGIQATARGVKSVPEVVLVPVGNSLDLRQLYVRGIGDHYVKASVLMEDL